LSTDWEAHYRAGDLPWDKGASSPALIEALERVELRGTVLVPGCGLGHDVRTLSAAGATPLGLDISAAAIEGAGKFIPQGAERYELGDLFALPPRLHGGFDWVWEHTCYCAIDPARRSQYVEACALALRPGGHLLGVFYLDPGQPLPTDGPPFETTLADLGRHFAPHFALVQEWPPGRTYPGREGREWVRWYRRFP
jgi:SAM-dependent methyltransferase